MYAMEAIRAPFQGAKWLEKLVILLILGIVPIIGGLIIGGYGLRVIRHALNDEEGLPMLDDLGGDLIRGVKVFVVSFIYGIPLMILSGLFMVLVFPTEVTFGYGEPTMPTFGASQMLALLLFMLLSIIFGLVVTAAVVLLAQREEISDALQVGRIVGAVVSNPVAAVMLFVNAIVFGVITGIIVAIGMLLLVIPGMLAGVGLAISQYIIYARYTQSLGLLGKPKREMV